MAKTREQKEEILKDLEDKMSRQKSLVLMDYSNIASSDLFDFRSELKKSGCQLVIPKKTLFSKVLDKVGMEELGKNVKEMKDQIALVFGFEDEITPNRLTYNRSKDNEEFGIIGGILDNSYIEKEQVIQLAKLPGRNELIAKLLGSLKSPTTGFVGVLGGTVKSLVYTLNAIKENK